MLNDTNAEKSEVACCDGFAFTKKETMLKDAAEPSRYVKGDDTESIMPAS